MRHRLDVIDEIADFLEAEARKRKQGQSPGEIHDFEGSSLYISITPRASYTTIRIGRWSSSTARKRSERDMVRDDLYITVYFGSAPAEEVTSRSDGDSKRLKRQMRNAFRAKTFPLDMDPFTWSGRRVPASSIQGSCDRQQNEEERDCRNAGGFSDPG